MKATTARQFLSGFLLAIASLAIIVGGFSLAMAEGGLTPADTGTPAATASLTATPTTLTPTTTSTPSPSLTATQTPTASPTPPANCPPPPGWVPITVQQGQTLESIALQYNTTVDGLMQANCLTSTAAPPAGTTLYVPSLPSPTPIPCGAPSGWVIYTVQSGDTLYHIATLYRISVPELTTANCLTSTVIYVGQRLYVPNVPTSTPSAVTTTPTPSGTLGAPTNTLTSTPTSTSTDTSIPLPSDTPTPTDTTVPPDTSTPTNTPTP